MNYLLAVLCSSQSCETCFILIGESSCKTDSADLPDVSNYVELSKQELIFIINTLNSLISNPDVSTSIGSISDSSLDENSTNFEEALETQSTIKQTEPILETANLESSQKISFFTESVPEDNDTSIPETDIEFITNDDMLPLSFSTAFLDESTSTTPVTSSITLIETLTSIKDDYEDLNTKMVSTRKSKSEASYISTTLTFVSNTNGDNELLSTKTSTTSVFFRIKMETTRRHQQKYQQVQITILIQVSLVQS